MHYRPTIGPERSLFEPAPPPTYGSVAIAGALFTIFGNCLDKFAAANSNSATVLSVLRCRVDRPLQCVKQRETTQTPDESG